MGRIGHLAGGLVVFFSLVFTGGAGAEVVDRIVAVVNNDIVTLSELNKAVKPFLEKIEAADYPEEKAKQLTYKVKRDMLDRIIERRLIYQETGRLNLRVSVEEVDQAIERFKRDRNMTQEDLEKALAHDGITFDEYRDRIRKDILRTKVINKVIKAKVVVLDREVEAYYNDHKKAFSGEKKYHLRNILMEDRDAIESVRKLLDQGLNFAALAQKYSRASNASEGGDLGVFELETFSEKLKQAITHLKKGAYTDVISTDSGYQIFYLEGFEQSGGKTLEQARDEIVEKLYDRKAEKKMKKWIESLKEKAHIKIML